jgi:hypothetical protein
MMAYRDAGFRVEAMVLAVPAAMSNQPVAGLGRYRRSASMTGWRPRLTGRWRCGSHQKPHHEREQENTHKITVERRTRSRDFRPEAPSRSGEPLRLTVLI